MAEPWQVTSPEVPALQALYERGVEERSEEVLLKAYEGSQKAHPGARGLSQPPWNPGAKSSTFLAPAQPPLPEAGDGRLGVLIYTFLFSLGAKDSPPL